MVKSVYIYEYDLETLKDNLELKVEHKVLITEKKELVLSLLDIHGDNAWITNKKLYKSTGFKELDIQKMLAEDI